MLDEFTDDVYNIWIHLLFTNKLTEFIVYVNPYVKRKHGTNEFMYDFLDEFTEDSKIIYELIYDSRD